MREENDRTSRNLAPACWIYFKLRWYGKLAECTTALAARVAAGDTVHRDPPMFESDVTAMPDVLRAITALDLGQPQRTLEYGRAALPKMKEGYTGGAFADHAYRAELLPAMGIAASLLGDRAGVEWALKQLDEMDIPYIGGQMSKNQREIGRAQLKLALGRYEEALGHLQEELEQWAREIQDALLGGGESFNTLYSLQRQLMAAKCQIELGRLEPARKTLDEVLAHKRVAEQGDVHWIALFERGRVAEREAKPAEAIEYYRRAIEIIERQRASLSTEASKIGFVGNKQQVYARAVALLVAAGRAAEAFDTVERSKSRALVDMLAQKTDFALRGEGAARAKASLDELQRTQAGTVALAAAPGTRSVRVVQDELRSADPELASLVAVTSVPPAEIGALLEPGETLVVYYYDDAQLYAFVLAASGLQAVPLERKDLVEDVQALRRAIELPPGEGFRSPAQRLHARLVAPLEPHLAGAKLAIVAHGALHYLPFAALAGADGRFLVERWSVRAAPSASALKFLRPPRQAGDGRILAFGNPDLGDPKLDLAFAESEAREVAGLFPASRVVLRRDASESAFRADAASYARIHFATHGKFRADSPLDSGLYLAKDAANDGVLRVAELYAMNLDADLVTLSACETALGAIGSGDDVVGLTRGFLYAGARSIVSSLWSVDDKATAALMRAFYANLRTMPKREALRQAQLEARKAFPHPFFWAAFQLVGRPD